MIAAGILAWMAWAIFMVMTTKTDAERPRPRSRSAVDRRCA